MASAEFSDKPLRTPELLTGQLGPHGLRLDRQHSIPCVATQAWQQQAREQLLPPLLGREETTFPTRLAAGVRHALPAHDVLMLSSCERCGSPAWPTSMPSCSRRSGGLIELECCPVCGGSYASGSAMQSDAALVRKHLDLQATGAAQSIGNLSSRDYFAVLRAICQLLIRKGGTAFVPHLPTELPHSHSARQLEYLPPAARHQYIAAATWLLDGWPSASRPCAPEPAFPSKSTKVRLRNCLHGSAKW